jgi:hypothetical protein
MSCGRIAKRALFPEDDDLPCGTRLYYGNADNRTMKILLCAKCEAVLAAEDAATAPTKESHGNN